MDRVIAYAGALTSAKDILNAGRNAMVGLAELSQAVLGPASAVDGFTCTPTSPASLSVILTAGQVYQLENLEASAISGLAQDTHTILKQGIMLDPVTLAITPPTTVGYSQIYLIEVQYQDDDSTTAVLNYYNSSNTALPFYGPPVNGVGSGQAQTTVRRGKVAYQVKAGIAATTGTQVAPSPDAGWIGLFLITVANGQTTITSGNIATSTGAPFIPAYLPQVPARVQSGAWVYAADTSASANTLTITLNPIPSAYTVGMGIRVKVANANTGATVINVNGLSNVPVVRQDGTALQANDLLAAAVYEMVYDGTSFRVVGYTGAQVTQTVTGTGTTIYVRTDGSDSNDGSANTAQKALLTPQAAVNLAIQKFNLAGKTCTIQLGIPGTYAAFKVPGFGGNLVIQGDVNNQDSYVISGSAGTGSGIVSIAANVTLQGLQIYNGSTTQNALGVAVGGNCTLANVSFNGVAGNGFAVVQVFQYAFCWFNGPIKYMQSAAICWYANSGSFLFGSFANTFANAVTFTYTAEATACGTMAFNSGVSFVNPANVTGQRYVATVNGVINTFGGGASFIPGSTAGSTATGGEYV